MADVIVFLRVCGVQAYGNGVDIFAQDGCRIGFVKQICKTVCVQPHGQRVFLFEQCRGYQQIAQPVRRFAVTAVYEFGAFGKVYLFDGIEYFVDTRFVFEPQAFAPVSAFAVAADAEVAIVVAAVGYVQVYPAADTVSKRVCFIAVRRALWRLLR